LCGASLLSDQLIIAGFHRSGTSLTAQLLHRAGLFLGDDLLDANLSNPYGHFEDWDVVGLHQNIFADNGLTWIVGEPFLPVIRPSRWERMKQIIESRNSEHRLWGFKDPRACLFIMLWKYLMPDAKVLLVYRHFTGPTRSLASRHSAALFSNEGNRHVHRRFWDEPDLALRMWLTHNNALLAFARAYPEDMLAVSLDMIRDGFPIIWAINRRWDLGLEEVPVGEVFDPVIATGRSGQQPVSDYALISRVEETWRALEDLGAQTERMLMRKEAAVVGE
jgi:hypothetical protein